MPGDPAANVCGAQAMAAACATCRRAFEAGRQGRRDRARAELRGRTGRRAARAVSGHRRTHARYVDAEAGPADHDDAEVTTACSSFGCVPLDLGRYFYILGNIDLTCASVKFSRNSFES